MAWTLTTKFLMPADWMATVGTTPVRKVNLEIMGTSDDVTELTAQSVVDISTITGVDGQPCRIAAINAIQYDLAGVGYASITFDKSVTDELAFVLVPGVNYIPFSPALKPSAAAGTNDIFLSTIGSSATGAFTIGLDLLIAT